MNFFNGGVKVCAISIITFRPQSSILSSPFEHGRVDVLVRKK